MTEIEANYRQVLANIGRIARENRRSPRDVSVVAVSKGVHAGQVAALAKLGHKCFGENRVIEGVRKMEAVGDPGLQWHMIGRIQTNKIRYLCHYRLIHSLDRWPLAEKMDSFALKRGLVFNCLVQVNIASDTAKAGIDPAEIGDFIAALAACKGLRVWGLMTITALEAERELTRHWFETLAALFNQLQQAALPGNAQMKWLSMGMSGDYDLAVAAGANLVRIGSAIFQRKE